MFHETGVGRGDRVCLCLPNCLEFLYCWFGLSLIGGLTVPINTAYKRDEVAYILNNAEAKALVAHQSLLPVAREASELAPSLKHKLVVGMGEGTRWSLEKEGHWLPFSDRLAAAEVLPRCPPLAPSDISMLVYTSGTTGNPKGVMVTHQMYVAAGQGFATWTRATSQDRFFTCLPYFHANAQYYSTMGATAVGATLAVVDRFSASRFWRQVRETNANIVNFIGMMLPVLAQQPESPADKQHHVRLFYGSPALSPNLVQAFEERFGSEVIVGFGMTETCYGAIERIGEPRRSGSSGKARQNPDPRFVNRVRIVDDGGQPVGPGIVGEISIKNPAVAPGYWRNEEQTQLAIRDGWLYTGDLGRMDEEEFLYFVDRKKDVIRRRGENVSSQEVEEVIKRHSSVMDCAVIGVPSELGEDEVKAYIVVRPSIQLKPEDIIYWCAQHLAYFKVPRYIELRDQLPQTPTLKVRKDLLRRDRLDLARGSFDREQAGIRLRP